MINCRSHIINYFILQHDVFQSTVIAVSGIQYPLPPPPTHTETHTRVRAHTNKCTTPSPSHPLSLLNIGLTIRILMNDMTESTSNKFHATNTITHTTPYVTPAVEHLLVKRETIPFLDRSIDCTSKRSLSLDLGQVSPLTRLDHRSRTGLLFSVFVEPK